MPDPPPPPPSTSNVASSSIGTLPSEYKRMSQAQSTHPPSNRMYLLIPLLICVSLLWFAWSQWHHPPQIQQRPVKVEDPNVKKRVWWMPDLLKTLPPFADGYRVEKYIPKYNLTSCSINGNFPKINGAIFCYLNDSSVFEKANKTISTDLKGSGVCGDSTPLTLSHWEDYKLLKLPVRRIVIVQQPLERFARQFRKICEVGQKCYNCKDNLACFMRKLLKDHRKLAEGLQGHIRTYLTNNFSPQTWNCHLHSELHNVKMIKLGGNETEKAEFADQLNVVLNEQGVAKELQNTIKEEVMKIPLELSEEERKIMETVKKDQDLWRLFRYLYEHDFTVFGYQL